MTDPACQAVPKDEAATTSDGAQPAPVGPEGILFIPGAQFQIRDLTFTFDNNGDLASTSMRPMIAWDI
ncbi:hypothetical protein JCM18899A_33010 [Nocardioides sp. AN3]